MPADPPNYAFEPQSPRDSGCLRMVLAGLLGMMAGVVLTIVIEATVLPGLFGRVHDFFGREAAAPKTAPPVPTKALDEDAKKRELEETMRRQQDELEESLKRQEAEMDGNKR